jgi:hypothetical protein
MLAVVVYVPWLQRPFSTFSFTTTDWILIASVASTVVPVLAAVKWIERHRWFGELS